MNKNYVLVMLFSQKQDKVLLVKRNKMPYVHCWNGVGGKIEAGETVLEAAKRECLEETRIALPNPRLLVTYVYPETNVANRGSTLNVVYDFVEEVPVADNAEGHYEWKDIEFALDPFSQEIAGLSNLSQFIKEIYDLEGIRKFYE